MKIINMQLISRSRDQIKMFELLVTFDDGKQAATAFRISDDGTIELDGPFGVEAMFRTFAFGMRRYLEKFAA